MGGEKRDFGFPSRPPGHLIRFGAAALAPPVITLLILEVVYALAVPVCAGKLSSLPLHIILVLTIAGLAGIGVYGRRFLKRSEPLDSDQATSIASFTALILLTITALCLLIVVSQWIAVFAMPCTY